MKRYRGPLMVLALAACALLVQPGCAQPVSWLPSAVGTLRLTVAAARAALPRMVPARAVCVEVVTIEAQQSKAPERACSELGEQVLDSILDTHDALSREGSTCR